MKLSVNLFLHAAENTGMEPQLFPCMRIQGRNVRLAAGPQIHRVDDDVRKMHDGRFHRKPCGGHRVVVEHDDFFKTRRELPSLQQQTADDRMGEPQRLLLRFIQQHRRVARMLQDFLTPVGEFGVEDESAESMLTRSD
jgi:hypothetical protein